jgi:hypothetical protein
VATIFPLVGRVLQIPPPLFFGLAYVGCLLVLAYLVTLLDRARSLAGADWPTRPDVARFLVRLNAAPIGK